jgi:hypothetical protein
MAIVMTVRLWSGLSGRLWTGLDDGGVTAAERQRGRCG